MVNQYDLAYVNAMEMRRKRKTRTVLLAVGLPVLSIALLFLFLGPLNPKNYSLKFYPKTSAMVDKNYGVLPVLSELPEYEEISYGNKHSSSFVFYSDSVALKLKYDLKTYEAEKLRLNKEFEFLSEYASFRIIPINAFKINSYTFRVVSTDRNGMKYGENAYSPDYYFPHNVGMVAYSDKEQSIAYLSFYDPDLDVISIDFGDKSVTGERAMQEFVKDYFRMKW